MRSPANLKRNPSRLFPVSGVILLLRTPDALGQRLRLSESATRKMLLKNPTLFSRIINDNPLTPPPPPTWESLFHRRPAQCRTILPHPPAAFNATLRISQSKRRLPQISQSLAGTKTGTKSVRTSHPFSGVEQNAQVWCLVCLWHQAPIIVSFWVRQSGNCLNLILSRIRNMKIRNR